MRRTWDKVVCSVMVLGLAAGMALSGNSPARAAKAVVVQEEQQLQTEAVKPADIAFFGAKKTTTTVTKDNQNNSSKRLTKAQIKKNKRKAKKYKGKKLSALVKVIGKYKKFKKESSCIQNQYQGVATFEGFKVYCHAKKGQNVWYIDYVL